MIAFERTFTLIFCLIAADVFSQGENFSGLKKINGSAMYLSVKGKGDPLLILHGGPGLNHSYFVPFLDGLEKDLQIIYYDQRACGQSAIPSVDSISMKFLVDDIEAIRKELKVEKLNILAHSWGAVLAVHYAERHKVNIKSLIFSNPGMLSREYDQEAAALVKQRTTKEDSTERAKIFASGNLDASKYDALLRITFKASAYDPTNISKINLNLPGNFMDANQVLFTALMKDPSFTTDMYKSLNVFDFPVLILQGESDLIPPRAIDRLKTAIKGAKLVKFKKSGHFPFVEETNLYHEVVLSFLKPNR